MCKNDAAGRTKCLCWPDLTCGSYFAHPCTKGMGQIVPKTSLLFEILFFIVFGRKFADPSTRLGFHKYFSIISLKFSNQSRPKNQKLKKINVTRNS